MNILGIYGSFNWEANTSYDENGSMSWLHDSGASLIINGNHVCSISEERLSRIKYDGNFPKLSIDYCLSEGNLHPENIDLICITSMCLDIFYEKLYNNEIHKKINEIFPNAKIKIVSHHLSHAAAAIFTCDFNEGTFLILDGAGSKIYDPYKNNEITTETNSIGYFNKYENVLRIHPGYHEVNDFGTYYRGLSQIIYERKTHRKLCDYEENIRESLSGKIMGLSAYGEYQKYDWKDYSISLDYELPFIKFKSERGEKNLFNDTYSFKNPEDMSSILQKNFESALLDYIIALKNQTYLTDNVCFSGGCFLNVLANTSIKKLNLFKNIHIPPCTNDSGLHFGAACYGAFLNKQKIKLPENIALLGKKYQDAEILQELKNHQVKYQYFNSFDDLCDDVASYLHDNKIIGWFQNRSEFGPRALGSRSLLMNPSIKENKDIMNTRVKHREYWRPFAGIILEEDFHDYFNENFTSDYMLYSFSVKESKISELGAITHVDNTCRVQTVNKQLNPEVTILLKKYKKISGIPVLLNTSFNDNGDPIVETPKDAIMSFLKMDLDYLIIGNYIVEKNINKKNKIRLIY